MKKQTNENKPSGFTWNWGKGLTLAILLFIVTTLSVVGYIISLDYHMVTENHYEKAVNYQEHIDRLEQAGNMTHPVEIKLLRGEQVVKLQFPNTMAFDNLKGTVELYRPSDSSLDREMDLTLDENGVQEIGSHDLAKGKWLVKVSWSTEGKNYYKQESIFL
ncbi:MAG TPA: FixH family protein [Halalkalibaculum sp.]|nr:FixH family protein [Halalkalibaculum sp.]